jgi:hypothetical protein
MTATGTIRGKIIELDAPAAMPEGTRVRVEYLAVAPQRLTARELLALVEKTRGSIPATPEQVRLALEEDLYGAG